MFTITPAAATSSARRRARHSTLGMKRNMGVRLGLIGLQRVEENLLRCTLAQMINTSLSMRK
jgi:hypothetical protein